MSWRHTLAAGELPIARPPVKAVLLALGHHANDYTGECWPSLERLQLFTGLSRRAVQSALQEIERQGWLAVDRATGRGMANHYTLTLPDVAPLEQDEKGARPARKGAGPARKGAGDAPQSSGNHQRMTRAEPLPADWQPGAEDLAQATKDFPNADIANETNIFIARALETGECFRNPVAAWRAWLGRAEQFIARDRRNAAGSRRGRGAQDEQSLAELRSLAAQ